MESITLPESFVNLTISNQLKKECAKYNKIAIIGGKTALKKINNIIEEALILKEKEIEWYGGECSYLNVDRLHEKFKKKKIDLIIGIGGGKAIDTSKVIADYLNIDLFTIPTIAATCAGYTALSVMYNSDGSFKDLYFIKRPPNKIFIDINIIYNAPKKYILAGIGDTLAKYYEVFLKTANKKLNFNSIIGKKLSELCKDIIFENSEEGLKAKQITDSFSNLVQTILLTTGKVSLLVNQEYNGAIAHSICYGLTHIKTIEENHLHGEIVAYGLLLQLLMENKIEEYQNMKKLYERLNLVIKLNQLCNIKDYEEKKDIVISEILNSPNLDGIDYKITKEEIENLLEKN